jgi:hypothetical protein
VIVPEHEAACFRAGEVLAPGGEIRAAGVADAGGLAEVFVAAWRQAYPEVVPAEVLAALDQDRTAGWLAGLIDGHAEGHTDVAVRDGQMIGFVRYGTRAGEPGGYVFGLYVHPAKAGYAPDGSTRIEPEYQATEVRPVKVLS